jgi:hypothetical protein
MPVPFPFGLRRHFDELSVNGWGFAIPYISDR